MLCTLHAQATQLRCTLAPSFPPLPWVSVKISFFKFLLWPVVMLQAFGVGLPLNLNSKGKHFPNLIVHSHKSLYVTRHMPCAWILNCPLWKKNKVFKSIFLANCSCLEAPMILTSGLQHFKRLILCLEDNLYVLQSQQWRIFLVWIYREEKMLCENPGPRYFHLVFLQYPKLL